MSIVPGQRILSTAAYDADPRASFGPAKNLYFQSSRSHATPFKVILALAASDMAKRNGRESPQAIAYRLEAIQSINEAISDGISESNDSIITAITDFCGFEVTSFAMFTEGLSLIYKSPSLLQALWPRFTHICQR